MVPCMDFGEALAAMRDGGHEARRDAWNEGTVVGMAAGSEGQEYFYARNAEGCTMVWPMVQHDVLARDWVVL